MQMKLKVLWFTALAFVATGCQKARLSSAPPQSAAFKAPGGLPAPVPGYIPPSPRGGGPAFGQINQPIAPVIPVGPRPPVYVRPPTPPMIPPSIPPGGPYVPPITGAPPYVPPVGGGIGGGGYTPGVPNGPKPPTTIVPSTPPNTGGPITSTPIPGGGNQPGGPALPPPNTNPWPPTGGGTSGGGTRPPDVQVDTTPTRTIPQPPAPPAPAAPPTSGPTQAPVPPPVPSTTPASAPVPTSPSGTVVTPPKAQPPITTAATPAPTLRALQRYQLLGSQLAGAPPATGLNPISAGPKEWWKLNVPQQKKVAADPCVGNPNACPRQVLEYPTEPTTTGSVAARPPEKVKCEPFPVTKSKKTGNLDLLFVLDDSMSIKSGGTKGGKLGQLAREVKYFVRMLDPDTNYHIGVLPGHGGPGVMPGHTIPKSAPNFHGKLLTLGKNDPAVIRSEKLKESCKNAKNEHDCIDAAITRILEPKFLEMPKDYSGADGETLILSLYDAITNPENKARIQKQGLFRPDATLVVIFISDEQDGCYDFEGSGQKPVQVKYHEAVTTTDKKGRKKVNYLERVGGDPTELATLNFFCKQAVNGTPLKSEHVIDALEGLKGQNYQVSSVVYLENDSPSYHIPRTLNGNGREGRGHGFLDLISKTKNGVAADLNKVNAKEDRIEFASQMGTLGLAAKHSMTFNQRLDCVSRTSPDDVDPSTIVVRVVDRNNPSNVVAFFNGSCPDEGECVIERKRYNGKARPAKLVDGKNQSQRSLFVNVDPTQLNDALTAKGVKDADAYISFKTVGGTPNETSVPVPTKKKKKR